MFLKALIFLLYTFSCIAQPELRWNWNTINTKDLYFPSSFFWGCSDSAFQTEGIETAKGKTIQNSWTQFEEQRYIPQEKRIGFACKRWQHYKEDINLLAKHGMNMYRFSIEWAKIEPEEGIFDQDAMQHYIDMVDHMCSLGIKPMITLFHHTLPLWFANKGGFEDKYNTFYFARFARYVFQQLHTKIAYWIIMNEPIAYAFEAYWRGVYPPGKHSFKQAGQVAFNMLNMHVEIAGLLKTIDPFVQIGLVHVINPLDTYHQWNPLEKLSTKIFDYVVNDLTLDFFETGKFNWAFLVRGWNLAAPKSLDFIGINYYSHTTIKQTGPFKFHTVTKQGEKTLTRNFGDGRGQKVLYAEGLYRAIERAAILHKPIFITENGSSTENPALTLEYLEKHLYALSQALKAGFPVKGYLLWTLTDCFGWAKGYDSKHGIYKVDFATQERSLRPIFSVFFDTITPFLPKNRGI